MPPKKLGALLHVGQDEIDAGRIAGAKLKEMGGKIGICVNQEVGNVSLDLRCKGFAEGFGGKVTVLPVSNDPDRYSREGEGGAHVRHLDRHDPGTRRGNRRRAVGCGRQGCGQGGRSRRLVRSIGHFLKSVAAGDAAFAIDQQQYLQGYLPVVFLALNAKYGLVPGGNVPSGPNLITKEKAAQVVDLSAKGIR